MAKLTFVLESGTTVSLVMANVCMNVCMVSACCHGMVAGGEENKMESVFACGDFGTWIGSTIETWSGNAMKLMGSVCAFSRVIAFSHVIWTWIWMEIVILVWYDS